MKETQARSYGMLIGSMLIFGTIGIFRRFIPLSSALLACTRGFLGAVVLLIFMKLTGRRLRHGIGHKALLGLSLSGGLMGFNWILLFEAYNYTSVAVATLCYYMEPTIVILLSPLLFRERLTMKKLICAIVSVAGMGLVSGVLDRGGAGGTDIRGILLGLGAASLYSSVVILNKKIQVEDAYEKTVIQLLSAAIVLVPYLLVTEGLGGVTFTVFSAVMLLVVGLVHTGVAYALYFGSMAGLSAQTVAVLSYLDPVSALILSAAVLGERLSAYGIIGAVLIIGAALGSELSFRRHGETLH